MISQYMIIAVSICNVYYMHVVFMIWQCQDIQVIAIHAFLKIYLDIKMLDFDTKKKRKYFGRFYKYTRQRVLS